MLHCICGVRLNSGYESEIGYCSSCHIAIRQVWDKDANALGQVEGNVNKLDWTNYEDSEYLTAIQYEGDIIYE